MRDKKKTVLFFVANAQEARYALLFKQKNPQLLVTIFAQSIDACLELKQANEDPYVLYRLVYGNNGDYYKTTLKPIYKKSHAFVKKFCLHFSTFLSFGIPLVSVLQVLLEAECIEIFSAQDLFNKITATIKPDYYYIAVQKTNKTTSWISNRFNQANLITQFFVNSTRVFYFQPETSTKNKSPYILTVLSQPRLLVAVVGGLLLKYCRLPSKKTIGTVDFLLFSGGRNLFFYHKLFSLIDQKNDLRYRVVSPPNNLEHEWLLRRSKINYQYIDEYYTPNVKQAITKETKRFFDYVTKQKFPQVKNSRYSPAFLNRFELVLRTYGPKFIKHTALARQVIMQSHPSLVITTHDPGPSALPFVYLAKKFKILTLVLLHGYHDMHFGADHESDYIAVWGKLLQEQFSKVLGKKRKSLFSVGYPFLDELFTRKKEFWQKSKVVQFHTPLRLSLLMTVYQLNEAAVTKFLFDLFEEVSKAAFPIEIWLRTHPGQPLHEVDLLARYFNIKIRCNEALEIEEFVEKSDVIISWDTTAIIWALLAGKPLFYTTPWWGEGHVLASSHKAAWTAKNASDIMTKINKIRHNPRAIIQLNKKQKLFLESVLGVLNDSSSDRLYALVQQLITKKI